VVFTTRASMYSPQRNRPTPLSYTVMKRGDAPLPSQIAARASRLSVAPMMDWTDRHCRYFHRLMSAKALLYTEMVTAPAIVRGDHARLLAHHAREHPLALQLGGSDPDELAAAVRIATEFGYDEYNLNCGCPSDRVQSGTFGAVLMKDPGRVAECVAAMRDVSPVDVTVKCRIGVDEQEPEEVLPEFIARVVAAGVERISIHARKAWLQGLSPKENRDIPPLNYPLVYEMKALFPHLHISINGGVMSLDKVTAHLEQGMDGVMVGRAAYHAPADVLLGADQAVYGAEGSAKTAEDVALEMLPYIEAHLESGGRLHQITRHMLGLFTGRPGARGWRRVLSEQGTRDGAGVATVREALGRVTG